jgi:hypothetical protein
MTPAEIKRKLVKLQNSIVSAEKNIATAEHAITVLQTKCPHDWELIRGAWDMPQRLCKNCQKLEDV